MNKCTHDNIGIASDNAYVVMCTFLYITRNNHLAKRIKVTLILFKYVQNDNDEEDMSYN